MIDSATKDENRLIREILAGKSELFDELIAAHRLKLLSLIHSCKISDNDSQDILQQIQIKAFNGLSSFDEKQDFGGWIYTIAKNAIRDFIRQQSRIRVANVDFQDAAHKAGFSSSPEETVILVQSIGEIQKLISSMEEKNQKIYELRFVKEFSYKEIADEMNIPIGSVKTIIHRIKETICKKILTD